MQFRPFVYDAMNRQVPVAIEPMTPQDAALTGREPLWQTSWASEYLADDCVGRTHCVYGGTARVKSNARRRNPEVQRDREAADRLWHQAVH